MHITWSNAFALFLIGLSIAFLISWAFGVYAAIKEGGLRWRKALVHVLCFLILYPLAFFAGWTWWFIRYGFGDGYGSAGSRVEKPE